MPELELRPDGQSFQVTAEAANARRQPRERQLVDQVRRGEIVEWKDVDSGEAPWS